MTTETFRVGVADGRHLDAVVAGPPDGTAIVLHHGTPGAAAFWPPDVAAATERGLRLVGYSRPGTLSAIAAGLSLIAPPTPSRSWMRLRSSGSTRSVGLVVARTRSPARHCCPSA